MDSLSRNINMKVWNLLESQQSNHRQPIDRIRISMTDRNDDRRQRLSATADEFSRPRRQNSSITSDNRRIRESYCYEVPKSTKLKHKERVQDRISQEQYEQLCEMVKQYEQANRKLVEEAKTNLEKFNKYIQQMELKCKKQERNQLQLTQKIQRLELDRLKDWTLIANLKAKSNDFDKKQVSMVSFGVQHSSSDSSSLDFKELFEKNQHLLIDQDLHKKIDSILMQKDQKITDLQLEISEKKRVSMHILSELQNVMTELSFYKEVYQKEANQMRDHYQKQATIPQSTTSFNLCLYPKTNNLNFKNKRDLQGTSKHSYSVKALISPRDTTERRSFYPNDKHSSEGREPFHNILHNIEHKLDKLIGGSFDKKDKIYQSDFTQNKTIKRQSIYNESELTHESYKNDYYGASDSMRKNKQSQPIIRLQFDRPSRQRINRQDRR